MVLLQELTRRNFLGGTLAAALLPKEAFADGGLGKLDLYDKKVQEFLLNWTAAERKTKLNSSVQLPKVVKFVDIDKNVYKETWGSVPSSPVNTYHHKRNWVILSPSAKADSLVHEYVHYLQFMYDAGGDISRTGWEWDGVSPDTPELEAANIQRKFKALM